METTSIMVNETEIVIINKGSEKIVPIKPICEALGVAYPAQFTKLKEDPILSSTITLGVTVGADDKDREMTCLPLKYIFGWLFTINPNNVKPEIKQQIINYKKQCYEALFEVFTKRDVILKEKAMYQMEIEKLEDELKTDARYIKIQELKMSVKSASQRFNNINKGILDNQLNLFKK